MSHSLGLKVIGLVCVLTNSEMEEQRRKLSKKKLKSFILFQKSLIFSLKYHYILGITIQV